MKREPTCETAGLKEMPGQMQRGGGGRGQGHTDEEANAGAEHTTTREACLRETPLMYTFHV